MLNREHYILTNTNTNRINLLVFDDLAYKKMRKIEQSGETWMQRWREHDERLDCCVRKRNAHSNYAQKWTNIFESTQTVIYKKLELIILLQYLLKYMIKYSIQ